MVLKKGERSCEMCHKIVTETLQFGFCSKCFHELKQKTGFYQKSGVEEYKNLFDENKK